MQIDLNQFRGTFFQEVAEHLETMESALLALQAGKGDNETLHAIFRCAHSTKAGAGTFGFETMARFTHVLESLLDRMRNAEIAVTTPLVELLLRSVDVLRTLVDAAGRGETPPPVWREVIEELDRLRGAEAVIDKDLATSLLARDLSADALLILTGKSYRAGGSAGFAAGDLL